MYKEIKKLILSSFAILIISCKTNNDIIEKEYTDFRFIKGMEIPKNEGYQYSEKCFLFYSDYKFLTEEIFKYEKGTLEEYIYCSPEGPDIRNYNKEKYSKDKLVYSSQKLYKSQKELEFNKIKYDIQRIIKDTIIGKNENETILVILDNKAPRCRANPMDD